MMRFAFLVFMLSAVAARANDAPMVTAPAYVILTCDMASASDPAITQRMFRLAPRSLQQWDPVRRGFGPNLCLSFACTADGHRTTGTISSASLNVTISLDQNAKNATWRTVGASGLKKPHGTCSIGPDAAPSAGAR
jgi:hypothetical protein